MRGRPTSTSHRASQSACGSRSSQSANLALAEIDEGVSIRKIIKVLHKRVGPEVDRDDLVSEIGPSVLLQSASAFGTFDAVKTLR